MQYNKQEEEIIYAFFSLFTTIIFILNTLNTVHKF